MGRDNMKACNRKNNDFWKQLFLICIYRILLDVVYVKGVVPTYSYAGFFAHKDIIVDVAGWIIYLIYTIRLITVGRENNVTFSKTVVYTLFLLIYAPFSIMVSHGMYTVKFVVSYNIYWFVFIFFLAFVSRYRQKRRIRIKNEINTEKLIYVFGFSSLVLIMFISWKYTGFRVSTDLINVYDLRSDAANYNIPTILRYLFGWTRVINLMCFLYALIQNNRHMTVLFFFNQLLSFGIDGMKSSLLILFLALAIYILYRFKMYFNSYNLLALGINVVSMASIIEMIVTKSKWIVYLVFFRMEFLPVHIGSQFFDFFTKHEPDYYRTSFLRLFGVQSPYMNINYMISGLYSGDYASEANNGLISDAITNMGYVGIIIMPLILVLFLRVFDRYSQGIHTYYLLVLGIYYAIVLSNMFFLPSLLTGGWIIVLLLVSFLGGKRSYVFSDRQSSALRKVKV